MLRLSPLPLLFASLTLAACDCTENQITVTYPITEEEAAEPCEDLCERIVGLNPSSAELLECEPAVHPNGGPAFVCTYSYVICSARRSGHI